MLTFKSFFYNLDEELTPQQKREVLSWKESEPNARRAAHKHTDHLFGGQENDDIYEPLTTDSNNESEIHKAVQRHLGHEISIDDYKNGKIKDKYGREVKIGSLLQKTKADQKLINQFANDSTRQIKNRPETGLIAHITRSPIGVAGQTSRGQSWAGQSCKDFDSGKAGKKHLPGEVKNGTIVIYARKGEQVNDRENAIARASLQPFLSSDGEVVYKQDSYYGPKIKEFQDHVKNVEARLSSSQRPSDLKLYKIHPSVYNNTRELYTLHPLATSEHVSEAMKSSNADVRLAAMYHSSATSEHVKKGIRDPDERVRSAAIRSRAANSSHIDFVLNPNNEKSAWVRGKAIERPDVESRHIDVALTDPDPDVRINALRNKRVVTNEHIKKGLSDKNRYVRIQASIHPKVNIDDIIKDTDWQIRKNAVNHPKATLAQQQAGLTDKDPRVREAAQNRFQPHNQITSLI